MTIIRSEAGASPRAGSWHHDQSFKARPPDWTLLACESAGDPVIPTAFCDLSRLLDLLSPAMVELLHGLRARHMSFDAERGPSSVVADYTHDVVAQVEGGRSLFIAPATFGGFVGLTPTESDWLSRPLFSMFNWPEISFKFFWSPGDIVVWPNRRYVHRTLPFISNEVRLLRRISGHWPSSTLSALTRA